MPEQQLVEIARALGAKARILILDEPTASLSEEDTQALFGVIRRLRQQGVGMIYISHRLEELATIADRVTVLRDGRTIDTRPMSQVSRQDLIALMVGRELSAVFPKREVAIGDVVLELRGLGSRAAGVRDVDLQLRAGEIVGLAGLVGSGRTELARDPLRPRSGRCGGGMAPGDSRRVRLAGRGHRGGHRLRARGPPPPRRGPRDARRREHHAGLPRAPVGARRPGLPAGDGDRRPVRPPPLDQDPRHVHPRLGPFGRQPAEGGAQPMARDGAVGADPRRADAGRRRRREVGDPLADGRTGRPGSSPSS